MLYDFGVPQKALHLHKDEDLKTPKHQGRSYMIMEKFDGWFMYVDCINGKWQGIRSKTGRVLPSMGHYSRVMEGLKAPKIDIRLIFEAVIPFKHGPRGYMEFKDCNGKFNQTNHELQNVILKCHDLLLPKNLPFHRRYAKLEQCLKNWDAKFMHFVPVLHTSKDKDEWIHFYNHVLDKDGEGVILKCPNAVYSPKKRNADILKIKREITIDALVVGITEGKPGGKYVRTLGTLVVKTKNGALNNVSGMTDTQRIKWFNNPEAIVGKVVECTAMKILADGRLREGRFKAERFDKTEKDID